MTNANLPVANCVLVLEDEPILRMLAMEIVEDAGFVGIEAATAEEAINILESRNDIFVVFADINIPGTLDGLALANAIRDRWPPVEIIITSGQTRPQQRDLPARAVFMPKPYQVSKLTQTLRDFL